MELNIRDRVIVITGGTAGIGRACARVLATEGCRLVIGSRSESEYERVTAEVRDAGGEIVTRAGDLSSPKEVHALVDLATETFGTVDGLVACVGSTPIGGFDELTDEIWEMSFQMKFMATVRAIRAVLPHMQESGGGRIAILAGNTAQDPTPWMATSGAINAALGNLTSSLARQYGSDGIGVNCVNPGPVRTARYDGMVNAVMDREKLGADDAAGHILSLIPDSQVGDPADVAALVSFLMSPISSHVNGASIVIDGAQTWGR